MDLPKNWISEVMGIRERRGWQNRGQILLIWLYGSQKAYFNNSRGTPTIYWYGHILWCWARLCWTCDGAYYTEQPGIACTLCFWRVKCLSWVLWTAWKWPNIFIKSGRARHSLICTGEIPSRILLAAVEELKRSQSARVARDKIGALSVGGCRWSGNYRALWRSVGFWML